MSGSFPTVQCGGRGQGAAGGRCLARTCASWTSRPQQQSLVFVHQSEQRLDCGKVLSVQRTSHPVAWGWSSRHKQGTEIRLQWDLTESRQKGLSWVPYPVRSTEGVGANKWSEESGSSEKLVIQNLLSDTPSTYHVTDNQFTKTTNTFHFNKTY